jgi:hypothetical protein
VQRTDQFHEQMRAGGNGDDFRLGLGGMVRVREKPALRGTPACKNEQATGQQQMAVLIDVFHERIVAPILCRKCGVQTLFGVSQRRERAADELNVASKLFNRRLG